MLAPIYWLLLDSLQGAYDLEGVSRRDAMLAFVAIALFAGGVWLGVWGRPWRMPRIVREAALLNITPNALFAIATIAFLLGMGKFAIPCGFDLSVMWQSLLAERFSATRTRGQFGGWNAFSDALQYFGYLLPALAVALASRQGWRNVRTLIALLMGIIMTVFMAQEGGRRNVGVMVGMSIICWVLTHKRLGARSIIVILVASGLLLFVMQTMLEYRNTGFQAMLSPAERQSIEKPDYVKVDDNYYRLCQAIQLIHNGRPFVHLKFITYALVRPVPRVFWPGKPEGGGFDMADEEGCWRVTFHVGNRRVVYELWPVRVLLGGGNWEVVGAVVSFWFRVVLLTPSDELLMSKE